jgi:hypothetical protein
MSKAQTLDKRYRLDLLWMVKKQATARGTGRLNNYSFIRTFRHVSLFYSEKTFPEVC